MEEDGSNAVMYRDGNWSCIAYGGTGTINGYDVWGRKAGGSIGSSYYYNRESGTGGLLTIYTNTLYNRGTISSNGVDNVAQKYGERAIEGGSSGGGSVNVFAKIVEELGTQTAKQGVSRGGTYRGGAGGNGSVTINEVSSLLNYPEKKITIKANTTHQLIEDKFSYIKLNEIQTEDLEVGKLIYETLEPEIATISITGEITAKKAGTTKIKITDKDNDLSTYIIIEVIDQVTKSQIKEGNEFTLALKEDGTVWSYGKNISSEPIQITLEEKIVDIGAGNESSIALTEDGEVYTWGVHYGEGGSSIYEKTPIKEQIENIKQVDSVGTNFYALDNEGNVYIWGNGYTVPTKIETNVKIVEISGKLLLGENGKVYTIQKPTEEIKWIKNIATIAQGEDHNLFVTTTGHIHSIGKGEKGQLGNGRTEEKETPTLVKTEQGYLQNVIEVSAGSKTSMALTLDGKAYVWGENTNSKLGIEEETIAYATQITNLQNEEGIALQLNKITNIETGKNHSTISDENGYVYSVGLNTNGQLGTEDAENRTIYTQIGKTIITTNKEEYRVGVGESQTIIAKLQDSFNLKNNAIDENQNNFSIEPVEQQKITINDKTITGIQYGEITLTIKHKTNITKDIKVKVIKDMESIVQGFRDTDLPDGTHEISIKGVDYTIELINYYDDMTYTENTELGDNSTEYKTLVVKYHKNLTINEDVTLTAKQVDNLTYKKGMYICVLGDIHNEGTISMTARGTYNCEGQNVYLWKNIDDSYEYVPAVGGAGAEGVYTSKTTKEEPQYTKGKKGEDGQNRALAGGGSGATYAGWYSGKKIGSGTAGTATSYSGGAGSAGAMSEVRDVNFSLVSGSATNNGTVGGSVISHRDGYCNGPYLVLGGTGTKNGFDVWGDEEGTYEGKSYYDTSRPSGTGGLLTIYADTLYNIGTISANGVNNKDYKPTRSTIKGGASGGGSVNIFARVVAEEGTQTATGGISENKSGRPDFVGGAGGNGSITTNILGSILHYPEEKITIKTKEVHQLEEKFYYEKQNDIQTEDLTVGNLIYEIENPEIASVDKNGQITALKEGITRVKVTDPDNYNYTTYITIEVIDNERVYIDDKEIQANKGKEGYEDGTYYYATIEETAKVKVTAGNQYAQVSFNNVTENYELEQNITLDEENKITQIPVTITSKDGIVYETTIYIEKVSNNNNLGEIKINEEEIKPEDNKIIKYIIDEEKETTKIEINTEHEEAKIIITDKEGNPILDENGDPEEYKQILEKEIEIDEEITIYFKVVAENGEETQVYEIKVEKVSTDASLKEVYVKGNKIEANEKGDYIAYVLDIDKTAIVKAVANNKKANVKIAEGQEMLHIAEQEETISEEEPIIIPITVTPKLGEAKQTNLYIYKMSTSLKLTELTLDKKEANYYNEETHTYTFIVDNIKEEFDLIAVAESKYTTLKYGETGKEGSLEACLKVETTAQGKTYTIVAESKAGTKQEYKIDIVHKTEEKTIEYLKVNDKMLQKDENGNYQVKLPENVDVIEIVSAIINQTEEESNKKVDINNTGKYEAPYKQVTLDKNTFEGKESIQVPIKVLEEDGTINESILTINFQKGTYITGRILTENVKGEYIADVTVYKLEKGNANDTGTGKIDGSLVKEQIAKVKTNKDGTFKILVYMTGETEQTIGEKYEIVVTKPGYLDYTVTGIQVQEENETIIEEYKLIAGDIIKTGEIELDDLVNLNDNYGDTSTSKHPEYDLNEDGKIDKIDREILKKNYTKRE